MGEHGTGERWFSDEELAEMSRPTTESAYSFRGGIWDAEQAASPANGSKSRTMRIVLTQSSIPRATDGAPSNSAG